ncbi:MAG: DNA polymerase I, partial [Verrucomicrobiae bacterium]|nr:DNA polymerase I [Verrucomicrobiae bacterium]
MAKRLFLLDGMALIYRAHFAFIQRPIVNSKGVNTSALYGFTNTLLDIIEKRQPTHLGVAFDTSDPTPRHEIYPAYKAQREAMPEDLAAAIPHVFRMVEAFNIPLLRIPGFEADDLIGTMVKRAEVEGFESYMVTPDKDFSQLVSDKTFLYRPGRKGGDVEILGVPEVLAAWGIKRIDQVIDIQGLQGDAVDNIPGVPGVGPKTAQKLIEQFDTLENLLASTSQLKGKQKERLEEFKEQALLSRELARIIIDAPITATFDDLEISGRNEDALKELCTEFEFNSIGKRLLGGAFKAGHGSPAKDEDLPTDSEPVTLKTIADVPHAYRLITKASERAAFVSELEQRDAFCFDLETTGLDPRNAGILGLAFSFAAHQAVYVSLPHDADAAKKALEEFRDLFTNPKTEKVGHNLKFDCSILKRHGIDVRGRLFDTMIAHSLIEPDQRHKMDYLAERYLGYTPIPISKLIGDKGDEQLGMALVPVEEIAEYAAEDADVTWQLREKLIPLLKEHGQERVFYEIEAPLISVLVDMEYEGVRVDAEALADYSVELGEKIAIYQTEVHELAGETFNLA